MSISKSRKGSQKLLKFKNGRSGNSGDGDSKPAEGAAIAAPEGAEWGWLQSAGPPATEPGSGTDGDCVTDEFPAGAVDVSTDNSADNVAGEVAAGDAAAGSQLGATDRWPAPLAPVDLDNLPSNARVLRPVTVPANEIAQSHEHLLHAQGAVAQPPSAGVPGSWPGARGEFPWSQPDTASGFPAPARRRRRRRVAIGAGVFAVVALVLVGGAVMAGVLSFSSSSASSSSASSSAAVAGPPPTQTACPASSSNGVVTGSGPGDQDSGPGVIEAFNHAYYVQRSAAAARAVAAPGAVAAEPVMQAYIDKLPVGTTHCLSITTLAPNTFRVVLTEIPPDSAQPGRPGDPAPAPPVAIHQRISTIESSGKTWIASINPDS